QTEIEGEALARSKVRDLLRGLKHQRAQLCIADTCREFVLCRRDDQSDIASVIRDQPAGKFRPDMTVGKQQELDQRLTPPAAFRAPRRSRDPDPPSSCRDSSAG